MSVRVVPMSEEQHKSAKKRWGLVKAEVKLGMFGKAMQHKKKIAAAVTVKIIIIVVIVVIATTVVAAVAAYKNQDKLCANGYTRFCPKPKPVANKEAAKAFSFGRISVIPPKTDEGSARRRLGSLAQIGQMMVDEAKARLRGGKGRRLAIDPNTFAEDSDYNLASTSFYVSEESAEAMNTVSMILCDIAQLRPAYFVNQGPYKAQVDESKCGSPESEMMEWTANVKTVGARDATNTLTCTGSSDVADGAELTCGFVVDIWFIMGGGEINVQTKVWKPINLDTDPLPKLEVQFKLDMMMGDQPVKMTGSLMKKQVNQDNTIKFGQFMTMGEQTITQGGIHIEYNEGTGSGKVWSQGGGQQGGSPSIFKLAFDKNFVKKSKDNTVSCLNITTPRNVGSQYSLYDKNGKTVVFEEGFPIEATDTSTGKKYEAWAGYHGLHVHSRFDEETKTVDNTGASLFVNGADVEKINYDASSSRTPYTLRVDNGRLMKISKKTVTLGDLKGITLTVGHGKSAIRVAFNGTGLMKVGKVGGMCFDHSGGQRPTHITGPQNQWECGCHGSNGQGGPYSGSKYFHDTYVDIAPEPFFVTSKQFPWGMHVSAGEGSARFDGQISLQTDTILKMWVAGPTWQGGSFTKGQNVTQGSAVGEVYESTPGSFTGITPSYHHLHEKHSQTCASQTQPSSWCNSGCGYIPKGAKLVQENTGAIGIVTGHADFNWRVSFTTISGTFTTGNAVKVMDPDEKSGEFEWMSINASFSFTQIVSQSHEVSVKLISGTFQEGTYNPSTYTWTPAPEVKIAGISQNDLWGFHKEQGKISVQPNANTIISYTTRKMVSADETVPALKCYDRCPKYADSGNNPHLSSCTDCNYPEPGILANLDISQQGSGCHGSNITITVSGISGAAISGTVSGGKLIAVKVSNVGTGCASSDTVSITVGNCAVAPQVTGECRQGTDDSATYGQANSYTFDGNTLKDASGNSLSESASEQGSPINSGVLFELTTAAKNAGKCSHDESQVCYHQLREQLTTFYEWETRSRWSQRVSLIAADSSTVKFQQPISVKYTHTGTKSNSGKNYDGAMILLSYENELRGFPEFCLDRATLNPTQCAPEWSGLTRNVPDFAVPRDAVFTNTDTNEEYVAKAGEMEQIMQMADSVSACSHLDNSQVPSAIDSSIYKDFTLSAKPDLSDKPTVVFSGSLLAELEELEASKNAPAPSPTRL